MLYVVRAVKERKPFVNEILEQIPEAIVYYDEFGDAMKSYLHVCQDIVKGQPAVLLEDDIVLTSDFKAKIEAVISEYPEILINFFSLSKKHTAPHFKKGREYCMNQCEYFPAGFSEKVVKAYQDWPLREKEPNAYDFLVGYAWGYNKPYLVWCPSLVQHRQVKSIIDPRRSSKRQSITFKE
jgi:GR25 family glycosyltransferase involved in LPS biosynthesis